MPVRPKNPGATPPRPSKDPGRALTRHPQKGPRLNIYCLSPGYLKAVWPDFGGAFLRSGRPRPSNLWGAKPPTFLKAFPGPRGRPDLKNAPNKSGQTAFRYPVFIVCPSPRLTGLGGPPLRRQHRPNIVTTPSRTSPRRCPTRHHDFDRLETVLFNLLAVLIGN
jgi:hypothetical protein